MATFCDATNECTATAPYSSTGNPCDRADYHCWFHGDAGWKIPDCNDSCGHESLAFDSSNPRPANANSYPPRCGGTGLPQGALVVDNVPSGTQSARTCTEVATTGSFQFTFAGNSSNQWPSKVDLHELGLGFNGHFWFTHMRVPADDPSRDAYFGGALNVSGTWALGQTLDQWAQVYVHMPTMEPGPTGSVHGQYRTHVCHAFDQPAELRERMGFFLGRSTVRRFAYYHAHQQFGRRLCRRSH